MAGESYGFAAPLWRWAARREAWFFLTVPTDASEEIAAIPRPPRGFGGVRVRVRVGGSAWETSIFPDSRAGAYVLPMRRAVLVAEGIEEGDLVDARIDLL
ncbi:MAG: hypothetical protein BGO95_03650 [Micrococcales bacterium 73-13]|nr:MAG: hypothetical protein BGO95_03650 [Micrococcales bacterium 73-13]